MKIKLLSLLGANIIKYLGKTLCIREINPEAWKNHKKVIFAFWHGEQFIPFYIHNNQKITVMASLSKDGEIQSGILKALLYNPVRGSSSKGGDKALVEMIRFVKKGSSAGFAVDGPRGPIYEVKKGVLYLSQKTGCPIVPISSCSFYHKIFHNAWDKYEFPLPFSKAVIAYGKPFTVQKETDLDIKADEFKTQLNKLSFFAHKSFWSKNILSYLVNHPHPKILLINLRNKIPFFMQEVKNLRQKFPEITIVLVTEESSGLKPEDRIFFDEIVIIDRKNIFFGYLKDLCNFFNYKNFDLCLLVNNSFKEKLIQFTAHSRFNLTLKQFMRMPLYEAV